MPRDLRGGDGHAVPRSVPFVSKDEENPAIDPHKAVLLATSSPEERLAKALERGPVNVLLLSRRVLRVVSLVRVVRASGTVPVSTRSRKFVVIKD